MAMKYICYDGKYHATIVMFSNSMEHAEMYRSLNLEPHQIFGAGFVDFETMTCYGQSVSIDAMSSQTCTNTLRKLVKQ